MIPSPPRGLDIWPEFAEQEAAAIGQGLGHAPVHLEVGDPAQIAEARVGADQRVDPRAKLDDARRIVARVVRVAADEKKPAIVRQRREQDEAGGADNDADGFGRNAKANLDVGDHISPAIGLADEMLVHGMAGDVMRAPGAEQILRLNHLRPVVRLERHSQSPGVRVDGDDFGPVFHLDSATGQVIAQNLLRAPLRLTALKLIAAADAAKVGGGDLLHAWAHKLGMLDMDAGGQERLHQTGAVENLEHRRLERGPAGLVMGREPLLDDARLDAMAHEFAGREEAGGAAANDQH